MTTTAPPIDILQAICDPNILGDELSMAQEIALRAMYGLPLNGKQRAFARQRVGKAWQPNVEYREAAFVCGRRSGKSDKIAANVALYEAFFRRHQLSAGERGIVLLLAQNMRQAKVVKGYIEGKIQRSPILSRHVVSSRAQEIELDNRITIAIHPSSFRAIRGLSVVCCICDEIAFWWTEDNYANPDLEVVRAIRPAMATFPHGKLVLVSSPYAKNGVLWDLWEARHEDPNTLVWHAPTRLMNPTVPQDFLEREKSRDLDNYEREYEARFTDAVSGFLAADAIDGCVVKGRSRVEPQEGNVYVAAIDAAFKGDRFTYGVCHIDVERQLVVVDEIGGWGRTRAAPLRPRDVMPEIRRICQGYGVQTVYGDQFGAAPLAELFASYGLAFEEVPFTAGSKANIYGMLRSLILDGCIELLDHKASLSELRGLEVELLPGGTSRIGGRRGSRDDYADAMALAVFQAMELGGCVGEWEIDEPEPGEEPFPIDEAWMHEATW